MKDIKHQMHIDELMGVIREYDEQSLNERAERYAFLLSLEACSPCIVSASGNVEDSAHLRDTEFEAVFMNESID